MLLAELLLKFCQFVLILFESLLELLLKHLDNSRSFLSLEFELSRNGLLRVQVWPQGPDKLDVDPHFQDSLLINTVFCITCLELDRPTLVNFPDTHRRRQAQGLPKRDCKQLLVNLVLSVHVSKDNSTEASAMYNR